MSISDVLAEYDRIRANNERELARRKKEVFQNVPGLKQIHDQKNALQLRRITESLSGTEFNDADILALREKANMLLVGAGYDIHYLDPMYTCPVCRDTGTKDDATRCECFTKRVLEDKLAEAKLTDESISFEHFDLSIFSDVIVENGLTQKESMRRIKQHSEKFVNSLPHCETFLVFSGPTGLGKTYLAKCIQRRTFERGFTAAFYTAYNLHSKFYQHRLSEPVDLSPVFEVPLLIIDDLGTEPMTRNVTKEYFFDLINERSAADLHTVIVTNLAFAEIKNRYGDRIHSRLMDQYASKKILFKGRDVRY